MESDLRLDDADIAELLLGILSGHGRRDDDIITRQPVDGSGNTLLVGELESVDDTEDLSGVTAGRGRVGDDEADLLVGVNDEYGTDGQGQSWKLVSTSRLLQKMVEKRTLRVNIGGVIVVNHVIQVGNLALGVGYDGELEVGAGDLVNVLDPLVVRLDAIGALQEPPLA
jgi:hypothetical protein